MDRIGVEVLGTLLSDLERTLYKVGWDEAPLDEIERVERLLRTLADTVAVTVRERRYPPRDYA